MNQITLFAIGTVIFFAVATAVFLYGLAAFRELQVRDETATRVWDAEHPSVPTAWTERGFVAGRFPRGRRPTVGSTTRSAVVPLRPYCTSTPRRGTGALGPAMAVTLSEETRQ